MLLLMLYFNLFVEKYFKGDYPFFFEKRLNLFYVKKYCIIPNLVCWMLLVKDPVLARPTAWTYFYSIHPIKTWVYGDFKPLFICFEK